jgi:hypothetical protein
LPLAAPVGDANIDSAVAVLTQKPPNQPSMVAPNCADHPAAKSAADDAAASKPHVNPPLALDGYCPVSLVEKHKWVPGDKTLARTIRTHRSFAGPEEQAKFLANLNYDCYAPVASGLDIVVAAEEHRDVPGKREHGVVQRPRYSVVQRSVGPGFMRISTFTCGW